MQGPPHHTRVQVGVFATCDDLLVMRCSNKNENTAVVLQLRWRVLIIIILLPVRGGHDVHGSTDDLAEHAGQHASTWDGHEHHPRTTIRVPDSLLLPAAPTDPAVPGGCAIVIESRRFLEMVRILCDARICMCDVQMSRTLAQCITSATHASKRGRCTQPRCTHAHIPTCLHMHAFA
jgi:hypothetical protein